LLIAGAKTMTEQLLAPLIGNGNFVSGSVKLLVGGFLPKAVSAVGLGSGKAVQVIATALAIDGAEDMIQRLFGGGVAPQTSGSLII